MDVHELCLYTIIFLIICKNGYVWLIAAPNGVIRPAIACSHTSWRWESVKVFIGFFGGSLIHIYIFFLKCDLFTIKVMQSMTYMFLQISVFISGAE